MMTTHSPTCDSSSTIPFIRCIELFSGIGGMHYALKDAKINAQVIAAFDINTIANHVYQYNFGIKPLSCNIEHLDLNYWNMKLTNIDCWLLSPPCQPFTRGGNMLDDKDNRSIGLLYLIDLLKKLDNPPKFLFLENVLNFEKSKCRNKLLNVLNEMGYQIEEWLISPMDPWINIPNDRLRYYLTASLTGSSISLQKENFESESHLNDHSIIDHDNQHIITNFSKVFGPAPNVPKRAISDFVHTINLKEKKKGIDSTFLVPEKFILEFKDYRHDIVHPLDTRCSTFTKAYGSKYIIGTGSFLQTQRLEELGGLNGTDYRKDDISTLMTLGLRYFTPREIALFHGLPWNDDSDNNDNIEGFRFPHNVSILNQYRLLGNSMNIKVVSLILQRLLNAYISYD